MAKRMILMLGVVLVVITALGFMKFKQVETAIQVGASFQPPPEAVTSIVAQREQWPATMDVIGTMEAVHGVTVSADLPGVVARIQFESGQSVHAGDVLVVLDTKQERAQLASLEAQSELARVNFGRERQLVDAGVISRMEFDQATAQQKATEANVAEIRATIERKTIRAPFSGILGIRKVNLGQYLSAGSAVVPLQSLNPIYVDFGVPQQSARQVRVGGNLQVTSGGFRRPRFQRQGHGSRFGGGRNHARHSSASDPRQSGREVAARHVRPGRRGRRGEPLRSYAAGIGDQLCTVWQFGFCHHRS